MNKINIIKAVCGSNKNITFAEVSETFDKYERKIKLLQDAFDIDYVLGERVYSALQIYEGCFIEIANILFLHKRNPELVREYISNN